MTVTAYIGYSYTWNIMLGNSLRMKMPILARVDNDAWLRTIPRADCAQTAHAQLDENVQDNSVEKYNGSRQLVAHH